MRQTNYLRETPHAGYIAEGRLPVGDGDECRVELLHVKDRNSEEIRFSWWRNGKYIRHSLELTEDQLLDLFRKGIINGVFKPDFRQRLRRLL